MAKTTIFKDCYVEVNPDMRLCYFKGEKRRQRQKSECESIATEIRRHVDCGSVRIVEETEDICEYCGAKWSETDPLYNGGCCDKDMDNREEYINNHNNA